MMLSFRLLIRKNIALTPPPRFFASINKLPSDTKAFVAHILTIGYPFILDSIIGLCANNQACSKLKSKNFRKL